MSHNLVPVKTIVIMDSGIPVELRSHTTISWYINNEYPINYEFYDEDTEFLLMEAPYEKVVCILAEKQLDNLRLAKVVGVS